MTISHEDVQLAIKINTGRGNKIITEYQIANWLRGQGRFFSMGELRELLGKSPDDIDDEIRRGINGTLERMGS